MDAAVARDARTMLDKIWAEHVIVAQPGGEDPLYVDLNLIHEGGTFIEPAQAAAWDQAITSVMQSEQIRKDAEFNRWTIDPIGHRDLPAFLDREVDNYRRALGELGLQK